MNAKRIAHTTPMQPGKYTSIPATLGAMPLCELVAVGPGSEGWDGVTAGALVEGGIVAPHEPQNLASSATLEPHFGHDAIGFLLSRVSCPLRFARRRAG